MNPHAFARLCYLVLMQNGAGILDKSPDYIRDKIVMIDTGYDAFSFLDYQNQGIVMTYLETWHIEPPEEVAKYYKEVMDTINEAYDL